MARKKSKYEWESWAVCPKNNQLTDRKLCVKCDRYDSCSPSVIRRKVRVR